MHCIQLFLLALFQGIDQNGRQQAPVVFTLIFNWVKTEKGSLALFPFGTSSSVPAGKLDQTRETLVF